MTLKIVATNAFRTVLDECLPAFERARGITTEVEFASTNSIMEQLTTGDTADVVIATDGAIERLIAQGELVPGSRTNLASAGLGLCVRKGAPKPAIGSLDAFKKALLDAKSVAWTLTGQSGVYFAALLDRLDLAAAIKPKAVVSKGGLIGEVVARGEAELGVQQISEILAVPTVDLVGPFPAEVQSITMFSAGLDAEAENEGDARALVAFLVTDESKQVMREKGLEPA